MRHGLTNLLSRSAGFLLLAIAPAFALTFPEWQAENFTPAELADPAISGPDADPEGDGRRNLLEYALGLDPFGFDAEPVTPQFGSNGFGLTYPEVVGASDLLYHFSESGDLQYWITPNAPSRTILSDDGELRTVLVWNPSAPAAPTSWFTRLQVFLQPGGQETLLPPSRLSGTLETPFAIKLGWNDHSVIETGYTLEKNSGSGFVPVAELNADRNIWRDEAVEGSATYSYRVTARQGVNLSAPSNEFTITLPLDSDGDGLSDYLEINTYLTDPFDPDSDNDGMPDGWEVRHGFNPQANGDQNSDADTDGLTNGIEYTLGLDPKRKDSDNNGTPDAQEDADGDGMPNGWEAANGTNPTENDADLDSDVNAAGNPAPDGLTNAEELAAGTKPKNPDTDGDSVIDGEDGWALDGDLTVSRLPEVRYAVIELDPLGIRWVASLNDHCDILGNLGDSSSGVWEGGSVIQLPVTDGDYETIVWHSMNNNRAVSGWAANYDPETDTNFEKIVVFSEGQITDLPSYTAEIPPNATPAGFLGETVITNSGAIYSEGNAWGFLSESNRVTSYNHFGPVKWEAGAYSLLANHVRRKTVTVSGETPNATQLPSNPVKSLRNIRAANSHGIVTGGVMEATGAVGGGTTDFVGFGLIDNGSFKFLGDILDDTTSDPFPGITGVSESPNDPWIVGGAQSGFVLLVRRPDWKAVYPQTGSPREIDGTGYAVNNRGEVAGYFSTERNGDPTGQLLHNGRVVDLSKLTANHDFSAAQHVNNRGCVVAYGTRRNGTPQVHTPHLLIPVEMKWEAQDGYENVEDNKKVIAVDTNDNPATRQWMQGKGSRIFPDKKGPSDSSANRNRCILRIDGKIPNYTVYLKAFDVDDATPDSVDNAPAHKLDTNAKAGDDNMDVVWARTGKFVSSNSTTLTVTLDANGKAEVVFETTKQPGDNFRVAAAFKQEDLNVLQVSNPDGDGFIEGDSATQGAKAFNGVISPMLTVWRRLWLEFDSMGPPSEQQDGHENFEQVEVGTENAYVEDYPSSGLSTLGIFPALSGGNDRFENGKLYIGATPYVIVSNNTADMTVTIEGKPGSSVLGQAVKAFDDDASAIGSTQPRSMPYDFSGGSLIYTAYADAFIEPVKAPAEYIQNSIPFLQNRPLPGLADGSNKNLLGSSDLWAVYLLGAWQPPSGEDADPNIEGGAISMGVARDIDNVGEIYVETIRELELYATQARIQENVLVVHESGHQGGGDHNDGGIMKEGAPVRIGLGSNARWNFFFTPKTIRLFREGTDF